ncbi:DoxX family protein [Paenibacillus sp. Marseille-Q4541]|uniref:DoxX family protein n=1 Tax=Paenibacillus sp. Marseille-Q4541 TaxID=2831522 RepID=UPI001BA64234|nr:DoxX family protein [Paenibacillus sp. Marseille-Q4541]
MLATVLQIVVGVAFIMLGISKFTSKEIDARYKSFGLPEWFRHVLGIIEILGAVLLFIGTWNFLLGAVGAFFLAIIMASAIIMQFKLGKGSMSGVSTSAILLVMCVVILSMDWMKLS